MSKAEDIAKEIYKGDTPITKLRRKDYCDGYHQAEKDNELTWEDIESICSIQYIVLNEYNDYDEPSSNILYQEVLKRFKDLKYVK